MKSSNQITPSLQSALPIIALSGLDPTNKPKHSEIYNQLKNSKTYHVNFLLRPLDHIYIKSSSTTDLSNVKQKDEVSSFDGIIKTKWLENHITEIPQVVALFTELSWFDPSFNEKALETASLVSILKQSIANSTKIALIVIQPENCPYTKAKDPLNQNQREAAERLAHLARTVTIPKEHVAEIDFTRFSRSIESVSRGLLTMIGHFCQDKIKSITSKISALDISKRGSPKKLPSFTSSKNNEKDQNHKSKSLNNLQKLKLSVKYYFKLGFYNEINCEVEASSNNEKATYKAYQTAYELLFNSIAPILSADENYQILSQNYLEIISVSELLSNRVIAFIIIQDLDLKRAVDTFQKHLVVIKNFMLKPIDHLKNDPNQQNLLQICRNCLYHSHVSSLKSKFGNLINKNWERAVREDVNKNQPEISVPGEYFLFAAKHLILVKENLNYYIKGEGIEAQNVNLSVIQQHRDELNESYDFTSDQFTNPVPLWLALQNITLVSDNLSAFQPADYLEFLTLELLPKILDQKISNLLKQSKLYFERYNKHFSRRFLLILLQIAECNPNKADQFALLTSIKMNYIPKLISNKGKAMASSQKNNEIFKKLNKLLVVNEQTPSNLKLSSAFETGDKMFFHKVYEKIVNNDGKMEPAGIEAILQSDFVADGSFICGFTESVVRQDKDRSKDIMIKFEAVTLIAKYLCQKSQKMELVITGEHGTGLQTLAWTREKGETKKNNSSSFSFTFKTQKLSIDEVFSIVKISLFTGNNNVIFQIDKDIIQSRINTLFNKLEYKAWSNEQNSNISLPCVENDHSTSNLVSTSFWSAGDKDLDKSHQNSNFLAEYFGLKIFSNQHLIQINFNKNVDKIDFVQYHEQKRTGNENIYFSKINEVEKFLIKLSQPISQQNDVSLNSSQGISEVSGKIYDNLLFGGDILNNINNSRTNENNDQKSTKKSPTEDLPLTITLNSNLPFLAPKTWNQISVSIKNQTSITRYVKLELDMDYYKNDVIWKEVHPSYFATILPEESVILNGTTNSVQFGFSCMPLSEIRGISMKDFFSVTDLTVK